MVKSRKKIEMAGRPTKKKRAKTGGRKAGTPNKNKNPDVIDLRSMVKNKIDDDLLERIKREKPEEILRAGVRLDAIFNPQKHEVSGSITVEVVRYE